ncbi:FAD-dependent oxidoreductase [Nonomuraea sp. B1E8]|uniref:FAD-dependent oxidoreductase n=1 Tax=unclassified Nonomuraea TaxID=2593643 RepID=UPI00325D5053
MTDRGIVVVGAGIVGASLAYHLAGHGRSVTLIDAGLPGSGATRASFAWIGRPAVSDVPSAPLRYQVRQLDDGTVLAPMAYAGETDQAALLGTARRVRDRFAASFAGAGGTKIVSGEIGWRPMPADGEPVIGRPAGTRGLYITVMHSAITLAAAAGRLAASEILTGSPAPELAGCRPDRFR